MLELPRPLDFHFCFLSFSHTHTHMHTYILCLSFGTSARMLFSTRFLAYSRDKKIWGIKIYHVTMSPSVRAANWGRSLPAAVRRVFLLPNIDAAPVSLLLISHQARIEFACRTFHFGIFLSDKKCHFIVYDVWCGELCECVIFWEWDRGNIASEDFDAKKWRGESSC